MAEYKHFQRQIIGKKFKKNTVFDVSIAIPDVPGPYALCISHDSYNDAEEKAMLMLAEENKAPYAVCIGVYAGYLKTANGTERFMRCDDYDLFNREYGDFLVYELIPSLSEEFNLDIVPSPDYHYISGGSSGGMSAMTVSWFHNEYFRRAFLSSPSFMSMGRGNEFPNYIRKCETKPIRLYVEYSENEPDEYYGSIYLASIEGIKALEYAGYDIQTDYFPGENHCSRNFGHFDDAYKRLEFIWKDYKDKPITAPRNSARIDVVVDINSKWEKTDVKCLKEEPEFSVFSSDKQLKYYANPIDDMAYKCLSDDETTTYIHGILHTLPGIYPKGAIDLAVDEEDRLYCLTMAGIQTVRSFGLIDVILDLPDDSKPYLMYFGKNTYDKDYLYVKTEEGFYRRKLKNKGAGTEPTPPKHTEYYD